METVLLLLVAALAVLLTALLNSLQGSISTISRHEVRHRAQNHERGAKSLYVLHARGYEPIVGFIVLRVLLSIAVIVILVALFPTILSVLLAVLLLTFVTELIARFFLQDFVLKQLDWLLPILNKLLILTIPIARPVGRFLDKRLAHQLPVIHGKQQLLEMLEQHKGSVYSDIENSEIEIAKHALSFGDKQIRQIMVPRSAVKTVSINEPVGPILMDELHKAGHTRFPVTDSDGKVVGTLFLRSLISEDPRGKVKDFMSKEVYYVHEEQPLGHALQAFLKTKHHLFVVVNNFEEFVGILTLEDVLEQILGKQIMDEFDEFENLRAVAALRGKKDRPSSAKEVVE